jgi:hypothetical protein
MIDVKIIYNEITNTKFYSAIVNGFLIQYQTDGIFNAHISREEWKKLALSNFEDENRKLDQENHHWNVRENDGIIKPLGTVIKNEY